jgi:hypothetical protein
MKTLLVRSLLFALLLGGRGTTGDYMGNPIKEPTKNHPALISASARMDLEAK